MRLINSHTLEFNEFFDMDIPAYAILSHTWEADEVSLQEMERQQRPSVHAKKGYKKIIEACRLARTQELNWVWVDTCCIDKKSSAELTEAINSMFQWYKQARVCFAYLSDWKSSTSGSPEKDETNLADCRWFTRGWTLQELIAPYVVEFYDCDWVKRGTKVSFKTTIGQVTGIPDDALLESEFRGFSIVERMSWAAHRKTTRSEDAAYCLLGIFDINMPLLYGEGTKAFYRLQEQLCKQTSDLTVFAWEEQDPDDEAYRPLWSPLFASSPADFRLPHLERRGGSNDKTRRRERIHTNLLYPTVSEFSITNKGLRLEGRLLRIWNNKIYSTHQCRGDYYLELGVLEICYPEAVSYSMGIVLQKCGPGVFVRKYPHLTFSRHSEISNHTRFEKKEVRFYIYPGNPINLDAFALPRYSIKNHSAQAFAFRFDRETENVDKVISESHWYINGQFFFFPPGVYRGVVAAVVLLDFSSNMPEKAPILVAFEQFHMEPYIVHCPLSDVGLNAWVDRMGDSKPVPSLAEFIHELQRRRGGQEVPGATVDLALADGTKLSIAARISRDETPEDIDTNDFKAAIQAQFGGRFVTDRYFITFAAKRLSAGNVEEIGPEIVPTAVV